MVGILDFVTPPPFFPFPLVKFLAWLLVVLGEESKL